MGDNSKKVLLKGNEAFATAAIRAGCRFYFGYPITPQNEVPEYMSRELSKVGGYFVQAESELAAINMAYGAAAAGGRVFISSSSPGIALMQEGISVISSADLPLVMMNVMRGGPGIGSIQPSQADYYQVTRGGGNGDYHIFVYAPASIQEAIEMIYNGYEIAEEYRNIVMIAADGMLGQMMEPVLLPEPRAAQTAEDVAAKKPWALTGHHDEREANAVKSLHLTQQELEVHLFEKEKMYEKAKEELQDWSELSMEDPEVVFVAFGSTSRIAAEAIEMLAEQGVRAGMIRPKTLWPFPDKAFKSLGDSVKRIISVELSLGQMIDDIRLATSDRWPISLINRTGGMLLSPEEITERTLAIMEGGL